jgi:hypothetical protein
MRSMRRKSRSLLLGAGALLAVLTSGEWRQSAWSAEPKPAVPVRLSPQPVGHSQPWIGVGVPAYVPAASKIETEVIEATRWLGIPVVRTARFPAASPVAFFCASALADRQFPARLRSFVAGGGRALLTSRLAAHLGRLPSEHAERIFVLPSGLGPAGVLALPQAQVDQLRNFALRPLGLRMEAPPRVALTLIGRDGLLVENRNSYAAGVKLTFLTEKWPTIQYLSSGGSEIPLNGSTVALQAPPRGKQRFQIVSR